MNSNTKQRRNSLSAFHGKLKARAEAVKAVVKKPAAETGHPENTNTIEDDALSSEESEQLRAEIRLQHGKVKSLEKSNQILRKQLDELQTLYTESENRCTIMNDENIRLQKDIVSLQDQLRNMTLATEDQDNALTKAQGRVRKLEEDLAIFMALEKDINFTQPKTKANSDSIFSISTADKRRTKPHVTNSSINFDDSNTDTDDDEETQEDKTARKVLQAAMFGNQSQISDDSESDDSDPRAKSARIVKKLERSIRAAKASSIIMSATAKVNHRKLMYRAVEAAFFKLSQPIILKKINDKAAKTSRELHLTLAQDKKKMILSSLMNKHGQNISNRAFTQWRFWVNTLKWQELEFNIREQASSLKIKTRNTVANMIMKSILYKLSQNVFGSAFSKWLRATQQLALENLRRNNNSDRTKLIMKSILYKLSQNVFGSAFSKWQRATQQLALEHLRRNTNSDRTAKLVMKSLLLKMNKNFYHFAFTNWKLNIHKMNIFILKQESRTKCDDSRALASKLMLKSIFYKLRQNSYGTAFSTWRLMTSKMSIASSQNEAQLKELKNRQFITNLTLKSIISKLRKTLYGNAFSIWKFMTLKTKTLIARKKHFETETKVRQHAASLTLKSIILKIKRSNYGHAFSQWRLNTHKEKISFLSQSSTRNEQRGRDLAARLVLKSMMLRLSKTRRNNAFKTWQLHGNKTHIELLKSELRKNSTINRNDDYDSLKTCCDKYKNEIGVIRSDLLRTKDQLRNMVLTKEMFQNQLIQYQSHLNDPKVQTFSISKEGVDNADSHNICLTLHQYQQTDNIKEDIGDVEKSWQRHIYKVHECIPKASTWFGEKLGNTSSRKRAIAELEKILSDQHKRHLQILKEDHDRNRVELESKRFRARAEIANFKMEAEKKLTEEMIAIRSTLDDEIQTLSAEKRKLMALCEQTKLRLGAQKLLHRNKLDIKESSNSEALAQVEFQQAEIQAREKSLRQYEEKINLERENVVAILSPLAPFVTSAHDASIDIVSFAKFVFDQVYEKENVLRRQIILHSQKVRDVKEEAERMLTKCRDDFEIKLAMKEGEISDYVHASNLAKINVMNASREQENKFKLVILHKHILSASSFCLMSGFKKWVAVNKLSLKKQSCMTRIIFRNTRNHISRAFFSWQYKTKLINSRDNLQKNHMGRIQEYFARASYRSSFQSNMKLFFVSWKSKWLYAKKSKTKLSHLLSKKFRRNLRHSFNMFLINDRIQYHKYNFKKNNVKCLYSQTVVREDMLKVIVFRQTELKLKTLVFRDWKLRYLQFVQKKRVIAMLLRQRKYKLLVRAITDWNLAAQAIAANTKFHSVNNQLHKYTRETEDKRRQYILAHYFKKCASNLQSIAFNKLKTVIQKKMQKEKLMKKLLQKSYFQEVKSAFTQLLFHTSYIQRCTKHALDLKEIHKGYEDSHNRRTNRIIKILNRIHRSANKTIKASSFQHWMKRASNRINKRKFVTRLFARKKNFWLLTGFHQLKRRVKLVQMACRKRQDLNTLKNRRLKQILRYNFTSKRASALHIWRMVVHSHQRKTKQAARLMRIMRSHFLRQGMSRLQIYTQSSFVRKEYEKKESDRQKVVRNTISELQMTMEKEKTDLKNAHKENLKRVSVRIKHEADNSSNALLQKQEKNHEHHIHQLQMEHSQKIEDMSFQMNSAIVKVKQSMAREREQFNHELEKIRVEEKSKMQQELDSFRLEHERKLGENHEAMAKRHRTELENMHRLHEKNMEKAISQAEEDTRGIERKRNNLQTQELIEKYKTEIENKHQHFSQLRDSLEEKNRTLKADYETKIDKMSMKHREYVQQIQKSHETRMQSELIRAKEANKQKQENIFDIETRRMKREADELASRKVQDSRISLEKDLVDAKHRIKAELELQYNMDMKLKMSLHDAEIKAIEERLKRTMEDMKKTHVAEISRYQSESFKHNEKYVKEMALKEKEFSQEKIKIETTNVLKEKELVANNKKEMQQVVENSMKEIELVRNRLSEKFEAKIDKMRAEHTREMKTMHEERAKTFLDFSKDKELLTHSHNQKIKQLQDEWEMKLKSMKSLVTQELDSTHKRILKNELEDQKSRLDSIIRSLESNIAIKTQEFETTQIESSRRLRKEFEQTLTDELEKKRQSMEEKHKLNLKFETEKLSAVYSEKIKQEQIDHSTKLKRLLETHENSLSSVENELLKFKKKYEDLEKQLQNKSTEYDFEMHRLKTNYKNLETEMHKKLNIAYTEARSIRVQEIEALEHSFAAEKSRFQNEIDGLKVAMEKKVKSAEEDVKIKIENHYISELSESRSMSKSKLDEQLQKSKLEIDDLVHSHKIEQAHMKLQFEADQAQLMKTMELEKSQCIKKIQLEHKTELDTMKNAFDLQTKSLITEHENERDAVRKQIIMEIEEAKIKAAAETRNRMTLIMAENIGQEKQQSALDISARILELQKQHDHELNVQKVQVKDELKQEHELALHHLREKLEKDNKHHIKQLCCDYESQILKAQEKLHKQSMDNLVHIEKLEKQHSETIRAARAEVETTVRKREAELRIQESEHIRTELNSILDSRLQLSKENNDREKERLRESYEAKMDRIEKSNSKLLESALLNARAEEKEIFERKLEEQKKIFIQIKEEAILECEIKFKKLNDKAINDIKVLETTAQAKQHLGRQLEHLQIKYEEQAKEIFFLNSTISMLETTRDSLNAVIQNERRKNEESICQTEMNCDNKLQEMEQKHIDSISHMTELHLIKIEDAIRINIQRVKEEEKEFYNEKEQQLIEKMKKSFSKELDEIRNRYELLVSSAQKATAEANDQQKRNMNHYEQLVSKLTLERADMKLYCDKEVIRARHSIDAHEEKCSKALQDMEIILNKVTAERDESLGKFRAIKEVAEIREHERARLEVLLQESIDKLNFEHKDELDKISKEHNHSINLLTENHDILKTSLGKKIEEQAETIQQYAFEIEKKCQKHIDDIQQTLQVPLAKLMLLKELSMHQRFNKLHITENFIHAQPPYPSHSMSPQEMTASIIENSVEIQKFMTAHAQFGSDIVAKSLKKSPKWQEWKIKRRKSIFALSIQEDKLNLLIWALFHFYAATGSPTFAASLGITMFKRFMKDTKILIEAGKVDLIFTKRCSMPSSDGTSGHDKRLEYDEFVLTLFDVSKEVYSDIQDSFHELFRINIIPRVQVLGSRVSASALHHNIHSIMKKASSFPRIIELIGHNRPIFNYLSKYYCNICGAKRQNEKIKNFTHIFFDGVLLLAKDFQVVPKICSISELQHVFHHSASSDKTDDTFGGVSIAHERVIIMFLAVSICTSYGQNLDASPVRHAKRYSKKELPSMRNEENWNETHFSARFENLLRVMVSGEGFKRMVRRGANVPVAKFWFAKK